MAGQPKTRAARAAGIALPERMVRPQRRRDRLTTRISTARTDVERLTAAFDYARGAMSTACADPDVVSKYVDRLLRDLIHAGDDVLTAKARRA